MSSSDEHGGGGGGKKREAMFGKHGRQTNIVCYPSQINKWNALKFHSHQFQVTLFRSILGKIPV